MANANVNKVVLGSSTLIDLTADTVTAENVIEGYTFHAADGSAVEGTLTHLTDAEIDEITGGSGGGGSSVTVEPLSVTSNGTYTAPSGSAYSPVTVNVPTPAPSLQSKSVSPTELQQTVTPDSAYDGLSQVTVDAIPSDYVGTAIAGRESLDLIVSGDTVTVPAGYYASQASASVDGGTAGTPTATKGAVSSHSVTVTPSVTNATGYITGGTKNGTAVTVSASELVSGSQTLDENGTYDVTDLASVTVNVPSSAGVNVQTYQDYDYVSATSYTATDVTLTVEVSGTYTVSWMGWRNTTSGTSGSQLYVNGSSRGSAHTTFVGSYGQFNAETGISLNAGDVVVIRARARSTSYRMYVGGLILQQTA